MNATDSSGRPNDSGFEHYSLDGGQLPEIGFTEVWNMNWNDDDTASP
jgi:hypothetical protein